MLGCVPLNASANELQVSISFEGKLLEFSGDGGIIEDDGHLLAPADELASQTGWEMEFHNNAPNPNLIKLVNQLLDLTVEAYTGSGEIFVNGQKRTVSTLPVLKDGRVFFPVKDFYYAMNCSVRWIDSSRTVDATLPLAKVFSGKEVMAKKASELPVISGTDEDAAWVDAKKLGDFTRIFYNDAPDTETNFKVTYDDNAMYVFVKCDGSPVPLEGVSLVIAPQCVISPETTSGHYQDDPLSLALYSNNQELLPDLGYTHTKYRQWSISTLGHNTVLVDSKDSAARGSGIYGGKINVFADMDDNVQIMKASRENAYPGLNEYDREPWYIKMEGSNDSYVVDIFRADGGSKHEYTLNGDANSEGATFAPNVEMGYYSTHLLPPGTQVTLPTGEMDKGSAEGNYYGYLYIEDVKKAELADGKYKITMATQDGDADKAGMKITGFAGNDPELFIGKAPSLRPLRIGPAGTANDKNEVVTGNYMPKMVVHREGTDLKSAFVNVMEPYSAGASPKITSVEKLDTGNPMDVAVKISYGNVTDVILSSSNPAVPLNAWDIYLTGKMAFIRYIDGEASQVYTVGTDNIVVNGQTIAGAGVISGKITDTMRKATGADVNAFVVDTAVGDSAVGKTMTVKHPDGSVNAFEIAAVTPQGTGTLVEVKDMDPGFEILKDGSSEMRLYPLTKWKGDHIFEICGETINSIE